MPFRSDLTNLGLGRTRGQHSGDASLIAHVLGVWTHLIPQQIKFSRLSALACDVPITWKALLVFSFLHLPLSKR